jgi:hypothetical protein
MNEAIFVDTWAFLALANINGNYNRIAIGTYKDIRNKGCRIVTSDYVLDELITALFKNTNFDDLSGYQGDVRIPGQGISGESLGQERFLEEAK